MVTEIGARHAQAARDVELGFDPMSDADLVGQVIGGSEGALAALYDRHGRTVFSAAMRASGDASIAEEVVQETFLTLWNRAELYDPTRGALSSWLQTITRNRTIDHLRAASRRGAATFSSFGGADADLESIGDWLTASGEILGAAGPEPGPEVALSSKETRSSIEEALATLTPHERSVITLAYQAGLSQNEIAARLGWPVGTVKTRTRRALRRLRDWFEAPHGGTISLPSPAPCGSLCH